MPREGEGEGERERKLGGIEVGVRCQFRCRRTGDEADGCAVFFWLRVSTARRWLESFFFGHGTLVALLLCCSAEVAMLAGSVCPSGWRCLRCLPRCIDAANHSRVDISVDSSSPSPNPAAAGRANRLQGPSSLQVAWAGRFVHHHHHHHHHGQPG